MTAIKTLIKREESRNEKIGKAMLTNFSDNTRTATSQFLETVEEIIARHLEMFLEPLTAIAVASQIAESLHGEFADMVSETQDNAIRIVEKYTSHFSLQIKQAIKQMYKETSDG